MNTAFQINIDSPYITKAEYLRRSGMNERTFGRQVAAGLIPIMPKSGRGSVVMVNMVKLAQMAAEQSA